MTPGGYDHTYVPISIIKKTLLLLNSTHVRYINKGFKYLSKFSLEDICQVLLLMTNFIFFFLEIAGGIPTSLRPLYRISNGNLDK